MILFFIIGVCKISYMFNLTNPSVELFILKLFLHCVMEMLFISQIMSLVILFLD